MQVSEEDGEKKKRPLRKITKQRLKNIALYYLQRFESSVDNLRRVLQKRVSDYAYQNKDYDRSEAQDWIEEILVEFQGYNYLNDNRFAELRIRDYLAAGKSEKYIRGKMAEKGVAESVVAAVLAEQEFDPYENALLLAKKKHIGPFRSEALRAEFRQKDMAALARAGFDYDVVQRVMETEV